MALKLIIMTYRYHELSDVQAVDQPSQRFVEPFRICNG